jgi:hypothetical protein
MIFYIYNKPYLLYYHVIMPFARPVSARCIIQVCQASDPCQLSINRWSKYTPAPAR